MIERELQSLQDHVGEIIGLALIVVALSMVGGCATTYEPIVDRPRPDYLEDLASCRAHARETFSAASGAVAGAAIGAGLGYVVCREVGATNCASTARRWRR